MSTNEMKTPEEYYDKTWTIIDKLYGYNKGYQLVKHLIDSYNDFILTKLDNIIEGFNKIEVFYEYCPEFEKFKYVIEIEMKNPIISKPIIYENDGSTKIMTPMDARNRNFTYAAPLSVDMSITCKTMHTDGEYVVEKKNMNNINIGKIPVMVNSQYCILKIQENIKDECIYDYGGYFVINGNEKVVISQDRIAENKTFVFLNNKVSMYSHNAEIRSIQDNKFSVPKTTSMKLSSKPNQYGRYIRVNIHHVKYEIPLFVLFRALGIESDKDIVKYIVYDISGENEESNMLMDNLTGSIEEANNVICQRDALEYLSKYLNINGYPKEYLNNKTKRFEIIKNVLTKEFLPHVGPSFEKKALYLGYMANKLLKCYLGILPYDDRDSYINKRVDTPGILMANLFRQYYGKVIKDMKNMISKEIHTTINRTPTKLINIINKINITKMVKSTIIESGLKYGLATGNWGIKNNKTKQGVKLQLVMKDVPTDPRQAQQLANEIGTELQQKFGDAGLQIIYDVENPYKNVVGFLLPLPSLANFLIAHVLKGDVTPGEQSQGVEQPTGQALPATEQPPTEDDETVREVMMRRAGL